jgi:hypothetical protein
MYVFTYSFIHVFIYLLCIYLFIHVFIYSWRYTGQRINIWETARLEIRFISEKQKMHIEIWKGSLLETGRLKDQKLWRNSLMTDHNNDTFWKPEVLTFLLSLAESSSSSSVGGAGGSSAYRTSAFEAVCTLTPVLVPHSSPEALHAREHETPMWAKGGKKWPTKFRHTIRLPRKCWVL